MFLKIKSSSVKDTEELGEKIAKKLNGGEFIALFGGLGAGKTAFVRGIAKGLNVKDDISSPTFAIVNEYNGKFKIYHFDMYRIQTPDDLESIGFFDYFNEGSIIITEWSENIENLIPVDSIKVKFLPGKTQNERFITIEGINEL